jgi:hypothetical protein
VALLALLFGFVPPASAAVAVPSSIGPTNPYIVAINDVAVDDLSAALADLGVSPTHTYDDVFAGFAIDLTSEQKTYLQTLFPGMRIEADVPISVRDTQNDAAWDISDLDAPGKTQDSNYKYPSSAGQGVRVYVLDTGVSPNSRELGSRLLPGYDAVSGTSTSDQDGHGTHVAGTVASNTWGVAKLANIVPVRVLGANGSGSTSDVIAGIDWVISHNPSGIPAVINMSLGTDSVSTFVNAAVQRAVTAGIFVAVAAGNDGQTDTDACTTSPASAPSAFTVGSVGRTHVLSYFSNVGSCVDILAQGEEVASLNRSDTSAGAFTVLQGTSMATPHVAGAAALYLSLHPNASVSTTKTALLNGAETNGTVRLGTTNKVLDISFMNAMPVVTSAPSVGSNTAAVIGQVVTANDGVWSSAGTYNVAKRWLACAFSYSTGPASLPNDCLAVPSATGSSITVARAQVGQYLMIEETATGENGTVRSYSETTQKVVEPAAASSIRNTDAPTLGLATGSSYGTDDAPKIAGVASTTLKISNGIWSSDNGLPTYSYQWYRCSNQVASSATGLPSGCVSISGQEAQTYTVTTADRGKYLLASVNAQNADGQSIIYTKSTLAVTSAPTVLTPTDFGNNLESIVGNRFELLAATFDSEPAATISLQWYSCVSSTLTSGSALPAGCSIIAGATSSSFLVTAAQKGKFILAATTAKNAATSGAGITSYSRTLSAAVAAAPTIKFTVTGASGSVKFVSSTAAAQNSKLTVDLTGWVTANAYTYSWYRCDSAVAATAAEPSGCEVIAGATAATYTVTSADVSKYVTSFVTAKNGTTVVATATSAMSSQVLQTPSNSVSPSIQGAAVVGQTVTAGDGTWASTPTAAYTYQWYSCSVAVLAAAVKNAKCVAIAGARSSNYEIPAAQNNKFLVVQVLASNSTNTGTPVSAYSASTLKVLTAPRNTVAPTLSYSATATTGQPIVGSTISVRSGTWTGNPLPTKTYVWYSCDAAVAAGTTAVPSGCSEIPGETGTSLVTGASLQTKYITVLETGSNSVSSPGLFAAVSLTLQPRPSFASDPVIQGQVKSGQTLTVATGASSVGGAPTASYLWYRCTNSASAGDSLPSECTPQLTSTGAQLNLTPSHEGGRYLVRVTITNVAGSAVRFSATTQEVLGDVANLTFASPRSETTQPKVGSALTVGANTWSGFPRSNPTYQWYRCNDAVVSKSSERPAGCTSIGGATGNTYLPTVEDESKYLSVKALNTQVGGFSAAAWSPTSAQIYRSVSFGDLDSSPAEPRPTLGNQRIYLGNNLTLDVGTTHGYPAPQKSYQWYRCDDQVNTSGSTLPAGCSAVAGETGTTYEYKLRDVGAFILASVTLTNFLGSEKLFTASTSVIGSAPVNNDLVAPRLPGTGAVLKIGAVVEASQGSWTALPDASYSYAWYRCQNASTSRQISLPNNCIDLGVSANTYELKKADSGKYIMYSVTAVNDNGEATAYSPTTIDVGEPTSFTADPLLQNRFRKDETIGSSLATAGWPSPQPTYRWFRCEAPVSAASASAPLGCVVIPRAISDTYTLTYADVSKYVVKEITITNRIDSSVRYTASSRQILLTPEISGNLTVTGQLWFDTAENPKVLTASQVNIKAFPETVPVYQWYRGGTAIRNANSITYTLTAADVGYQMSYTVSATNSSGVAEPVGASTSDEIGQTPKLSTVLGAQKPRVCGTETDGEISAGSSVWICNGDWVATPEVSEFTYQWYMCTAESPQGNTVPSTCTLIKGATDTEISATFLDEGKFLGFTITAKNGTEDRKLFAATSKKIYVKPEYRSGAKTVFGAGQAAKDGSPRVGYQIEASVGTWRGVATNTYSYQWFACADGATPIAETLNPRCEEIIGAESRVLTVTDAMVGKYLGVRITGSYKYVALTDVPTSSNRDIIYTASTVNPVLAPPANVRPPFIASRYTYVYATLKANDGEWTGSLPLTVTHTWWECDAPIFEATKFQPAGCTEIKNSTGNWKVTPAQVGKYLTSAAKASNLGGDVRIWSATQEVVKTGPVNVTAPVISLPTGSTNPSTSTEIRVSKGTWLGDPPPGDPSEYNWYRCDDAVRDASEFLDTGCQLIESARGNTYTPVSADVRKYLVASVKASNTQGDWVAYTASTTQVYLPPSNITLPSIPAVAFVGRNMTGAHGTWDGYPEPTLAYQWYVCDDRQATASATLPAGCELIAKATSDVYKPVVSQIDKYLILKVTAKNPAGETSKFTASSDSVVSGPVLVTPPTFTGSVEGHPVVGSSTTTDGGIWQGTPSPDKSYQWLVCDKDVTADDVDGQKDQPAVGVENPPSPTAFLTEKGCVEIEGATANAITPNETFRGKFLMIHVTARNIHGVDDWYSAASKVVWMAPVVATPVQVTGKTFNLLSAHARLDTWKAFPEPTKTYTWYYCSTVTAAAGITMPDGCTSAIAGANTSDYKIPETTTASQKYLVVKVVAHNAAGADGVSYSATSNEVVPGPANTVSPTVTGNANYAVAAPGTVLTAGGTWVNIEGNLDYQWYRCTKELNATDELNETCQPISGAEGPSYVVSADDVLTPAEYAAFNADQKLAVKGKVLVVGVTGSNARYGQSTVFSKSTTFVTEKVNSVTAPTISGLPRIDTTISGLDGTWRGFPLPTDSRKWFYCKTAKATKSLVKPADCSPIGNSNKPTLAVSEDFIGKYLVYSITKTNKVGAVTTNVTVYSASTAQVALTPVLLSKPDLDPVGDFARADAPKVGTSWKLTSAWKKPTPALTYQWYRCDDRVDTNAALITEKPAGCVAVEGANSIAYEVRVADQGKYLLAQVIGTNVSDSVTSFTNSSERPVAQPPIATTLPAISGTRNIGDTLSVTEGVWSPVATEARKFQWYSCSRPVPETVNEVPSFCDLQTGDTGSSYTISSLDAGSYMTVKVSGTYQFSTTSYLLAVTEATQLAPRIVYGGAKPILDYETFLVGDLFTIRGGEWEGTPTPVVTYKWYRCVNPSDSTQSLPEGCQEIPNATNPTYQAVNADNGKYLVGVEIATNSGGVATWYTESSDMQVKAGYVQGSTAVSISVSGSAITTTDSITINYTPGTWQVGDVNVDAVLVHRWIYCKEPIQSVVQKLPAGCDWMFPYKNAATFLVADEDLAPLVLSIDSPYAGYYIASMEYVMSNKPIPQNTVPIKERETFRVSASSPLILMSPTLWTNPPTTELLSTTNGNGYQAPRLSTNQYAVGDSGQTALSISYISKFLKTTDPWADDVTSTQRITWRGVGDPSWRPNQQAINPYAFATQWFRCETEVPELVFAKPDSCAEISGATSGTYTPVEADVSKYISARLTATNSVGSTSIWTKSTWHITQRATVKVSPALNSATTRFSGDTVTVTAGDWVGLDTPADAVYKFYLCSATTVSVANCGASPTNAALPKQIPSNGRSAQIPTLGGQNLTRYVLVEISRANYPYLFSDSQVDPSKQRVTTVTLATERIYERPVWKGVASVPLSTGAGTLVLTSQTSGANIDANVGQTLYMDISSSNWSATDATNRYSYAWFECSQPQTNRSTATETPSGCTVISGETSSSYRLTRNDRDKRIMGRIIAENTYASGTAWTVTTPPITEPPYMLTAPSITLAGSGKPAVGDTITGVKGTFAASPSVTEDITSYQWYACNNAVQASSALAAGCVPIPGAMNETYTISRDYMGKYLVYRSGASAQVNPNSYRAVTYHYSASVGDVEMDPEFGPTDPQITGTGVDSQGNPKPAIFHVGYTLKLSSFRITSNPTATSTWDWYVCDTSKTSQSLGTPPSDCQRQDATNQSELVIDSSMAGKYITVFASAVSRTNPTKKNAAFTKQVTMSPVNTAAPTLTGTMNANDINLVTASAGSWSAVPVVSGYSYAWYLCTSNVSNAGQTKPAGCDTSPISGEISKTIKLRREWAGKYLVVEETAIQPNNNTSLPASLVTKHYSASTSVIKTAAIFTANTTLSGYKHVGEYVSASVTKSRGVELETETYQWYVCATEVTTGISVKPANCDAISGATDDNYQLLPAHKGKFVTVAVTLTNSVGSVTNYAATTNVAISKTPTATAPVTISGDDVVGATKRITATTGTWDAYPVGTRTYRWYVCDTAHDATGAIAGDDCSATPITTNPITLISEYAGKYLQVAETATATVAKPGAGTGVSFSATLGPIRMAPVFTSVPTISGVLHNGHTLTAGMPTVTAYPSANGSAQYTWLSCTSQISTSSNAIPAGCSEIPNSAGSALVLSSAQVGKSIMLLTTYSNSAGSASKTSAGSALVSDAPFVSADPEIGGSRIYSATAIATVGKGTWSGSPAPSASVVYQYSYNWYLCTADVAASNTLDTSCLPNPLGSASSLQLTRNMDGKYLIAKVSVNAPTNQLGGTTTVRYTRSFGPIAVAATASTDPVISSYTPAEGSTLTADLSAMDWNTNTLPLDTNLYKWYSCPAVVPAGLSTTVGSNTVPGTCSVISGFDGGPLQVNSKLVGLRIMLVAFATNTGGTAVRTSKLTAIVTKATTVAGFRLF